MKRRLLATAALLLLTCAPVWNAHAQDVKPDDIVAFDLAAEDWVTTKTALATLNVAAAVTGANAGSMRDDMLKAVNAAAKGDWRLVSFDRAQDQTGLERWNASFESRLPETALNGLADAVKKTSKAGMQITVASVEFVPTLEETEGVRAALRTRLYKQAAEQLTELNSALPGRGFRIAQIAFDGAVPPPQVAPMRFALRKNMVAAMAADGVAENSEPMQKSEKLRVTAHVVLAAIAVAPAAASGH